MGYDNIQFNKAQNVLRGMSLEQLTKNEKTKQQLPQKGMAFDQNYAIFDKPSVTDQVGLVYVTERRSKGADLPDTDLLDPPSVMPNRAQR